MSKKNWSNILSVSARIPLAFIFFFGQTAWAMQGRSGKDKPGSSTAAKSHQAQANLPAATAAKTQSAEEEATAAENPSAQEDTRRGGQHEGIKVHGHWTIEVRNPDGKLVTHREFENSLAGGQGSFALSTVLARINFVGLWQINLGGPASGGPCPGSVNNGDCMIQENASPLSGSGLFNGLSVTAPTGANGFNVLQLSGTATAGTGQITRVQTFVNTCPSGTASCAPATTGGGVTAGFNFTGAAIAPINVSSGQTVAVTVVISFS